MDYKKLYTEEDLNILKTAQDSLNPKIDRIHEIIEYCKTAGIKRIGIANCIAFNREADLLEALLNENGLEISKVNCKLGRVPFSELAEGYPGVSCNPAGQAQFLEDQNTELNIMMGLCLGHDMIFNAKSKAPVTPLVVKDRKLKHHSLEALKTKNDKL